VTALFLDSKGSMCDCNRLQNHDQDRKSGGE
jgi:hypothetical protein